MPIAHYGAGDAMVEAHAMVSLVEQGWAGPIEVADAFGRKLAQRTALPAPLRRRRARRARPPGRLSGRAATHGSGTRAAVHRLRGEGQSLRQIGEGVGVSEKAIR